jgi:endonuclease/exonuclease/phosphatase family metal-dependent hydrolase
VSRLSRRAPLWVTLLALVPVVLGTVWMDPTSASADRGKGASAFTFGTHNSLRGTGRFTGFADVICWQEVALPQSKDKLVASLPGYDHYLEPGLPGQVPTSWRANRFSLLEADSTQAAPRVKSYSPPRYISRTVLMDRVTGRRVAIYNTHMVQGAWNRRHKPFKQMRQKNWREHAKVLRRELRRADADIPVLACGDFNRVRYLDLPGLDPIRRQGGQTGLDHLYRDTRGVRVRPARSAGNAGSDHPRLVTRVMVRS